MERFGLTVQAFDPTPKSIEWVKRQKLPEGFVMHEYGIADVDGDVTFSPPENPDHISHTILERPSTASRAITVPVKRLETIMREIGHEHIDLMKMDVEGAEYAVIDDLVESTVRPRQLLVEFHHRFESIGLPKTKAAVEALRGAGYDLVYITDSGEEYSFLQA
ncbi:MAG: FkbM family methyltransferase [Armatimonadetes bacterium]|nr:FkbM family methyltransferase [Armatimonadota bacterium]